MASGQSSNSDSLGDDSGLDISRISTNDTSTFDDDLDSAERPLHDLREEISSTTDVTSHNETVTHEPQDAAGHIEVSMMRGLNVPNTGSSEEHDFPPDMNDRPPSSPPRDYGYPYPEGFPRGPPSLGGLSADDAFLQPMPNPLSLPSKETTEKRSRQTMHYFALIEERLRFLEQEYKKQHPEPNGPLQRPLSPLGDYPDFSNGENDRSDLGMEFRPPDLQKEIDYVESERWSKIKTDLSARRSRLLSVIMQLKEAETGTAQHEGAVAKYEQQTIDTAQPLVENPSPRLHSSSAFDNASRRPDKVVVGSNTLLSEIASVTGIPIPGARDSFVWPFKAFVINADKFQDRYDELQKECHTLKARLAENKWESSPEPNLHESPQAIGVASSPGNPATLVNPPEELTGETRLSSVEESKTRVTFKSTRRTMDEIYCLNHFIQHDLKDLLNLRQSIREGSAKEIAFSDLWHLFNPGDVIITQGPEIQAYRILHVTGGRKLRSKELKEGPLAVPYDPPDLKEPTTYAYTSITPITIDCFSIDFDGKTFGPVPNKIIIQDYEGLVPIRSLKVYPLSLAENPAAIETMLESRGNRFFDLRQVSHKRYIGRSLKNDVDFNAEPQDIDSDVIIDTQLLYLGAGATPELEAPRFDSGVIERATKADRREWFEVADCGIPNCYTCSKSCDDAEVDTKRRTDFVSSAKVLQRVSADEGTLSKEQMVLLPYRIYGYVLLNLNWFPLNVSLLKDLKDIRGEEFLEDDGFKDLVLPKEHKRIVKALVKTHSRGSRSTIDSDGKQSRTERQLDVVKGKGRGLIILLHGVPGVGKTSTAECVAANTGRPLFPITCADIAHDTAPEVDRALGEFFDLAHKWGCVLLLDEADAFLGERIRGDLKQNSLVSIFLRRLEYYSGVLILTTNRVGQFDEAIKSRIHISLYYPELKEKPSKQIWKKNLERLQRENERRLREAGELHLPSNRDIGIIAFDDKEIMKFSKRHWKSGNRWNGRQIKNAFQTAIALAEFEHSEDRANNPDKEMGNAKLETKHFDEVALASQNFEQYLLKVRKSDSERARENENRYDYDSDDDQRPRGKPGIKRRGSSRRRSSPKTGVCETSDEENGAKKKSSKSGKEKEKEKGKDGKGKKLSKKVSETEESSSSSSDSDSGSDSD